MTDLTPDSPPTPPRTPVNPESAHPPASRRALTIGIVIGVIALLAGVWLVVAKLPQFLTGRRDAPVESTPPPAPAQTDSRKIHVSLFYVSESGLELESAGRDLPLGATPSEQARRIVEAQVHLPPEGKVSAIPPETTVRAVYLGATGDAYVSLGPEITAHMTGGALDEALAVYAIVNSLTKNIPSITSVQILVDGKEVDSLSGHIDLRRPLRESLDWVQKGK
jgi:hypothetical protein